MPRLFFSSNKRGTQHDQRLTPANKINNAKMLCPNSNGITATQKGAVVTMSCACGQVATFKIDGACASYVEAIEHFNDEHEN
jgi:hypothetical protein